MTIPIIHLAYVVVIPGCYLIPGIPVFNCLYLIYLIKYYYLHTH